MPTAEVLPMKPRGVRMSDDEWTRFGVIAAKNHRTPSQELRYLVEQHLKREERPVRRASADERRASDED